MITALDMADDPEVVKPYLSRILSLIRGMALVSHK
jgi:hypothetical protein